MAGGNKELDKKFDEVLARLDYLRMVISNLKERRGTPLTDFGDIDERLFREIANYEMSTEELKKDFILLLLQDARKFADACVRDTSLYRRSEEVFDKIESVLDFIRDHEAQDIEKSKELQDFAMDAKDELREIIKRIEPKIREKENEGKEYLRAWDMHNKMGFG
ncbi:MAG: hypothetical protein AABX34_05785 [Nanoarchaeota archaeon]|mgnify:CR=1 FL=1